MTPRIFLLALAMCSVAPAVLAQSAPPEPDQKPTTKDRIDSAVKAVEGDPTAKADTDMKHVLDALASLHPKPIETLSAPEARQQPTAADAVKVILRQQGRSTAPDPDVTAKDIQVDGAAGPIPARVYTPRDATGMLPAVVYYHGGGFVIATIDTYDASARAMATMANAVVVSVEYRKAPENRFPAQGEDAVAAYKWVLANAKSIGVDPAKIAVMGESAGGNLAINVAIAARDQKLQAPLHQVLVYPVAGSDLNTPSYKEDASAKPLSKAMMQWFFTQTIRNNSDTRDPRLDLVGKADLHGLPPATVITAEIDPLRSDGQMLAEKLKAAGVAVDAQTFSGVTHEFFGMGAVVAKAKQAEQLAAADLKAAFGKVAR